jgi:hypothetical protein
MVGRIFKMANELSNDEIEELVGLKDSDANFLKARKNGLLLTDKQVSTLERYNIDLSSCKSMEELIYKVEEANDGTFDDEYSELDYLADELSERKYYEQTRK